MPNLPNKNLRHESEPQALDLLKHWTDITVSKAFLSADFLLWLWYFSESSQNPFSVESEMLSKDHPVKIWIEDRIVLESTGSKAHIQTLRGGDPGSSIEAVSGLMTGKTVKELKIGIHVDSIGDFAVLLSSKDLAPKAVQLPNPEGTQSTLSYRLKMTELATFLIDSLFQKFLALRTSEKWVSEVLNQIEKWIENRGHKETHLH